MSQTGPYKTPWRLDPRGCGCTDCLLGDSIPLSSLWGESLLVMVERVDAGYAEDASGLSSEEWAALGAKLRMRYATSSSHQTAGGSRLMTSKPKGEPEDLLGEHKTETDCVLELAVDRHAAVLRAGKLLEGRKKQLEETLSKLHPSYVQEYIRRITEG